MKPDWKYAPEWANWLAMDGNGLWYWYENEPVQAGDGWNVRGPHDRYTNRYALAEGLQAWQDTMEPRP